MLGDIYKYPLSYMRHMYIYSTYIYNFLTKSIYNFLCSETGPQLVTVD